MESPPSPPTLSEIQALLEAILAFYEAHGLESDESLFRTCRGMLDKMDRMRWEEEEPCCVQTPQKVISSKENADISSQTPPHLGPRLQDV